jgi:serine protease
MLITVVTTWAAQASAPLQAAGYAERAIRFDASMQTDEETFSRFIVTYQDATAAIRSGQVASDLTHVSVMTGLDLRAVRWIATGGLLIKTRDNIDRAGAQRLIRELALIDEIRYAQPDYVYAAAANDPQIANQWHLAPVGDNNSYAKVIGWNAQAGANVIAGWDYSVGNGVVIGILDSGFTSHPDLAPNLAPVIPETNNVGFDFVQGVADVNDPVPGWDCDAHDPGNWDPSDPVHYPSIWHGTHVAGLAAAVYNNGLYGAGVAPEAKIMPVRIAGERLQGYESDLVDAIIWASGSQHALPPPLPGDPAPPATATCNGVPIAGAPHYVGYYPARVINLSWASIHACANTSMATAVTAAHDAGSVVVASAGNGNMDVSGVSPASCAGAIAVAATDFGGQRAKRRNAQNQLEPYSNYGSRVDLAAPGGGWGGYPHKPTDPPIYVDVPIPSDYNTGLTIPGGPTFTGLEGTSMAAPLVSGLAAAMASLHPSLSPDEIKDKIVQNVHHWGLDGLPAASMTYPMGAGLLDAAHTLSTVFQMPTPPSPVMYSTPAEVIVPAGQSGGYYTWTWDAYDYELVDVYISINGGPFEWDWVWPAHFHPTTQNWAPLGSIPWKLTPHGDISHIIKQYTVFAHH